MYVYICLYIIYINTIYQAYMQFWDLMSQTRNLYIDIGYIPLLHCIPLISHGDFGSSIMSCVDFVGLTVLQTITLFTINRLDIYQRSIIAPAFLGNAISALPTAESNCVYCVIMNHNAWNHYYPIKTSLVHFVKRSTCNLSTNSVWWKSPCQF